MRFRSARCLLLLYSLVILLSSSRAQSSDYHPIQESSGRKQKPPEKVNQEELLWWLPTDTESIVAARGPFRIQFESDKEEKTEEQGQTNKKPSLAEIRLKFEQLPLELFNDMDLATTLRGAIVEFAMQGSRHFRDPLPGFDVMDYEGCSIVIFKGPLAENGEKLLRSLRKEATNTKVIAGKKVLTFEQKTELARWSYFVVVPRPDVLLVSNNLSFLQEVLERMVQKKSPRALPKELPEWRFLNDSARYWGLRHYDRSQAKQDPTSPFSDKRTFGSGDKKAIGVLFALDPIDPRTGSLTFLSGDVAKIADSAKAGIVTANPEAGVRFEVKLRSPKPGVLEQLYSLDRTSTLDYFVLTIQISLGRGMYF